MKSYEAEIAGYKASKALFSTVACRKNILKPGVGIGPNNFKYYASEDEVCVIGVDPNKHMENYAMVAAGLPSMPPSSSSTS
uniref:Uncharacterized protein n=1 Tax=Zea mays TaxID=4577 RepID=A0A804PMG1_MAIZE